jgi:putative FmdB family regulatory protein
MPLYEFVCTKCGELHTDLVKLGTEKAECPSCGSISEKVMSVPNFILKGRGWAKDNYGLKEKSKKEKKNDT